MSHVEFKEWPICHDNILSHVACLFKEMLNHYCVCVGVGCGWVWIGVGGWVKRLGGVGWGGGGVSG